MGTLTELINLFRKPSPEVLAARELDEARRQLLLAQTGAEYADAMCAYHQARIDRLKAILAKIDDGIAFGGNE